MTKECRICKGIGLIKNPDQYSNNFQTICYRCRGRKWVGYLPDNESYGATTANSFEGELMSANA